MGIGWERAGVNRVETNNNSRSLAATEEDLSSLGHLRHLPVIHQALEYLPLESGDQIIRCPTCLESALCNHKDLRADVGDVREDMTGEENCHAGTQKREQAVKILAFGGSSPAVGSSRMRTAGSRISACAMPMRCRIPPE